jgi:hypothetical protein
MAYTAVPCMTTFTPQGYERMRSTAVELRGDYINTNLHHPCASDCTNDLNTNVDDILAVLGVYGSLCDPPCAEDVTGDGQVGVDDILSIIRSWGPCFACLSNQDCDDGDPWTLDRCHFGDCVHEPHLADCCIQGTCVRRIPAEVCETNDGVSMLTDTDCRWTCGRGDECLSAQQAFFGENRFTNQYATVGDLHPVDDTLCPDTNFAWDEPTDVWFWFNTSDPGTAAFSLCDADSFDTALVLYRGAYLCEDMVQIACSGDAPPETDCQAGHSSVTAEVGPGIEGRLFIRIAGQSGQTGHGTLTITRLE